MVLKETGHGAEWGEESPAETCCEPEVRRLRSPLWRGWGSRER